MDNKFIFSVNTQIAHTPPLSGTSNRTVAATQMNATSSRAHTVVTVTFDQISKNDSGQETKKSSTINLVDLAGRILCLSILERF